MNVKPPAPATVIACLALAFSLAGTSYAVSSLPNGSVGTAQIKKNAVVTSRVKNGSLRAVDFAAGQIPAGPRGPAGPAGPAGPQGATGTSPIVTTGASLAGTQKPEPALQFLLSPAAVTVPAGGSKVLVVASGTFGTGSGAANSLNLNICQRPSGGALVEAGNRVQGIRLPAFTRVPMGLSKVLDVPAGQHSVGLCGTSSSLNWIDNDNGSVTALVLG